MSFPEIVDIQIALEAADLQLNSNQRNAIEKQQNLFWTRLGDINPHTPKGLEIYEETLNEVEGSWEANRLKAELTRFNLERIQENQEL